MASICTTIESPAEIRVALVIEAGKIKPVWFEEVDRPLGTGFLSKKMSPYGGGRVRDY